MADRSIIAGQMILAAHEKCLHAGRCPIKILFTISGARIIKVGGNIFFPAKPSTWCPHKHNCFGHFAKPPKWASKHNFNLLPHSRLDHRLHLHTIKFCTHAQIEFHSVTINYINRINYKIIPCAPTRKPLRYRSHYRCQSINTLQNVNRARWNV
jgi:hypothetical protein